ncbi:MAG: hypothetical protein Q9174_004993, partial [Haloplaca sp. 1 TL-2023]
MPEDIYWRKVLGPTPTELHNFRLDFIAHKPVAMAYWRTAGVPNTSSVNGAVNFLQDAFELPPVCNPYDKYNTRNHVMGPEKP